MFEKASRSKIRFDSPKGLLSVEDLWDLPLTSNSGKANLDDIAKDIARKVNADEVSFVNKEHKTNDEIQLKFDVIKHIIDIRLIEQEAAKKVRENTERKQQILAIIAQKENEKLSNSSIEELRQMVAGL